MQVIPPLTVNIGTDSVLQTGLHLHDDSNNNANVNGDSANNGVEGSAVRVGLGTQFSFTKNFSTLTISVVVMLIKTGL